MKKSLLYITAVASLISSCSFDENWGPNLPARTEKTMEISISSPDKNWSSGDKVLVLYRNERSGYWSSDAAEFAYGESGNFAGTVNIKAGANYWAAYYPISEGGKISFASSTTVQKGYNNQSHIAAVMPYTASTGSTPVAENDLPSFTLYKAGAILKVSICNQLEAPVTISEVTVSTITPLGGQYVPKFESAIADFKLVSESGSACLTVDSNEALPVGEYADLYLVVKPFSLPAGTSVNISVKTNMGEKDASVRLKEDVVAEAGKTVTITSNISDFSTVNGEPFRSSSFPGFTLATVELRKGEKVPFTRLSGLTEALQPTFWENVSSDQATFKGEDGTYLMYLDNATGLIYTEFPITEGYPTTLWARGADNASGHPGGTVGTATWAGNGNPTNRQCCRKVSEGVYEIYLYIANTGGFRLYQFTCNPPGYWIQTGLSGSVKYTTKYNGSSYSNPGDDMPLPGEPGTYKVVIDMNACTGTYTFIK